MLSLMLALSLLLSLLIKFASAKDGDCNVFVNRYHGVDLRDCNSDTEMCRTIPRAVEAMVEMTKTIECGRTVISIASGGIPLYKVPELLTIHL